MYLKTAVEENRTVQRTTAYRYPPSRTRSQFVDEAEAGGYRLMPPDP
ncbi:hypothetical protein [Streptomyces griseorubiginosus]|nr:hypothetical protein [Streptomyces griseorubiginosus]